MKSAFVISTASNNSILEKTVTAFANSGLEVHSVKMSEKIQENCILSQPAGTLYFIENENNSLNYDLKKFFFRRNLPFFSFGYLDRDEEIVCCKGSLDIGADTDKLMRTDLSENNNRNNYAHEFNGSLAIEMPPDTIPEKYLFLFRYPSNIARTYISIMDKKDQRHNTIKILTPSCSPNFEKHFKKRAVICHDISELEPDTTVITWSTERFFTLLKAGFRPLPVTKCLALWVYGRNKYNLEKMILQGPLNGRVEILSHFVKSASILNFAAKTS